METIRQTGRDLISRSNSMGESLRYTYLPLDRRGMRSTGPGIQQVEGLIGSLGQEIGMEGGCHQRLSPFVLRGVVGGVLGQGVGLSRISQGGTRRQDVVILIRGRDHGQLCHGTQDAVDGRILTVLRMTRDTVQSNGMFHRQGGGHGSIGGLLGMNGRHKQVCCFLPQALASRHFQDTLHMTLLERNVQRPQELQYLEAMMGCRCSFCRFEWLRLGKTLQCPVQVRRQLLSTQGITALNPTTLNRRLDSS